MLIRSDLLQVRCPGVAFYVMRDAVKNELYLMDTGFAGAERCLKRALRTPGWQEMKIKGIIITHGHLDHILNAGAWAAKYGAWIAAPRLDIPHYEGRPQYSGWSHATGMMENFGRPLLGFQPFKPDRLIDDGDMINVWHGLKAVPLPGHTNGHMGYYCEKLKLMFTGDSFASFKGFVHHAPAIFSRSVPEAKVSTRKILGYDLKGVLPHHCDRAMPEEHLERLEKLCSRS